MCIKLKLLLCAFFCTNFSYSYARDSYESMFQEPVQDTTKLYVVKKTTKEKGKVSLAPSRLSEFPAVSLQQYLKGELPGLNVQEQTGEPGAVQNMFVRGVSAPLLSPADVFKQQPLVVLDGIPLAGEHPFAYDIQLNDFNRIGTATNLLSNIDMNNIETIELLKDISAIAMYGPNAANGAIILTSKKSGSTRRISINSYFGFAPKPTVTTLNASYENAFRKQFYDRYTANGRYSDEDVYPQYLSDTASNLYNGPSNWTDYYYNNALVHNLSADLSGGGERANFRFSGGNMKSQGVADSTAIDRYAVMFNVNMKPLEWLTTSIMINANRLQRDRNRNLRDRFGQTNYLPSLAMPLAPNKEIYGQYLDKFGRGYDNNINTLLDGYGTLTVNLKNLEFTSKIAVDYNEGTRDIFYARPLMEGNSYASNYFGYNQRLLFENVVSYKRQFGTDHHLNLTGAQVMQWDYSKYNYGYAYRGVNDFIKLNLMDTRSLDPTSFPANLVFRFLDKTRHNLFSVYGRGTYDYKDKFSFSLLLRGDASSNAQPTNRWFMSTALSAGWNVKNDLFAEDKSISALKLRLSAGRLGKLNTFDNYGQGPQYTADLGYTGNITIPGFNGYATLSRPYNFGWVGYGIPWAYTDQFNFGIDFGLANDRLQGSIDLYTKTDKNQLLGIPAHAEYGYKTAQESGMSVNNKGAELLLSYAAFQSKTGFSWTPTLNIGYNANKLLALPGGLKELIIGDHLLRVGESIDRFWLFNNEGIYNSVDEIPVVDGKRLQFTGTPLEPGDPKWRDLNGDRNIDNKDKDLFGHSLPVVVGGLNNDFRYGKWSFGMNLYFNLGRSVINQRMSNSLDFINKEGGNTFESVREITYWEKRGNRGEYPLYNPWSSVIPFRVDQDLFLENASFLKMRSLSAGYDLTSVLAKGKVKINSLYVYAMANNVFTITPYKGMDPEMVSYTGYDAGYGMPLPRVYTLGLKMNL